MHVKGKRRRQLQILAIALPVVVLSVVILRVMIARADVEHPDPETESAFLRGYTPANAFTPGTPLWAQLSGPDSAGRGCAFRQREFRSWFAIPSADALRAMTAVQRDLEERLRLAGLQIVAEKGDPREGFEFAYETGNIKGSVRVEPLVTEDPRSAAGKAAVQLGEAAVKLHIRISETWYRTPDLPCGKL
ncbi:MAG TPA: hypothetical protein VF748_03590 [Candidatus Acidoferrum sp.]